MSIPLATTNQTSQTTLILIGDWPAELVAGAQLSFRGALLPTYEQLAALEPHWLALSLTGYRQAEQRYLVRLLAKLAASNPATQIYRAEAAADPTEQLLSRELNNQLLSWPTQTSEALTALLNASSHVSTDATTHKQQPPAPSAAKETRRHDERRQQLSLFQERLFGTFAGSRLFAPQTHHCLVEPYGGQTQWLFDLSPTNTALLSLATNQTGPASALLLGYLQGQLQSVYELAPERFWQPAELLSWLSKVVYQFNWETGLNVRAWYGCLDFAADQLHYCNAGHSELYLFEHNHQALSSTPELNSLPLGCLQAQQFSTQTLTLSELKTLVNASGAFRRQLAAGWLSEQLSDLASKQIDSSDWPAYLDHRYTDHYQHRQTDRLLSVIELPTVVSASLSLAEPAELPAQIESYCRAIAERHSLDVQQLPALIELLQAVAAVAVSSDGQAGLVAGLLASETTAASGLRLCTLLSSDQQQLLIGALLTGRANDWSWLAENQLAAEGVELLVSPDQSQLSLSYSLRATKK